MAQLLRNPSWRFLLAATAAVCSVVGVAAAAGGAARHPDLTVSALSRPPAAVHPGGRFTITLATKNRGTAGSRRSLTRLYLSRNATKGRGDLLLGAAQVVPQLKPGHAVRVSLRETVPRGISGGRWWLVACADDTKRNKESRERNSCRAASRRLLVKKAPPPGSRFSGPFSCYGVQSLPSSCYSLARKCTTSPTSSAQLTAAISKAVGGNVICLNGNGTFAAGTVTARPARDVTIQPAAGMTPTLTIAFTSASHWHVVGVTVGAGMTVKGSRNITVAHSTWKPGVGGIHFCDNVNCSESTATTSANDLFDYNDYTRTISFGDEGRITPEGSGTGPSGVTFSHSLIAGEYSTPNQCADGISPRGHIKGVRIGPGNEFTGIVQENCNAHADPIAPWDGQPSQQANLVVTGNYFHDNGDGSGGVFTWGKNVTITNNVFLRDARKYGSYGCVGIRGTSGAVVEHNYFNSGCGITDEPQSDAATTGTISASNNVFSSSFITATCSSCTWKTNFNLDSPRSGTSNKRERPIKLVSSPASGYYHYQLARSSPGYHAGSDGKSMGISP